MGTCNLCSQKPARDYDDEEDKSYAEPGKPDPIITIDRLKDLKIIGEGMYREEKDGAKEEDRQGPESKETESASRRNRVSAPMTRSSNNLNF